MVQLLVLGVLVQSQITIDLSSPKATTLSFVKSFEALNFGESAKCVLGGKLENFEPMIKQMPTGYKFKLDLRDIEESIQGSTAVVTGNLWMKNSAPGQDETETTYFEKLSLCKVDKNWLIQPKKVEGGMTNVTPLSGLASIYAFGMPDQGANATSTPAQSSDPGAVTISNLKQLAVASLIYASDWDEKLPTANWKKQLEPYTKNRQVFISPMNTKAKPSFYTFNPALYGKDLNTIKKAAETVLIYEGSKGVISYLYNSRGAVAFVDSHVKLVSKAEAAQLRWKL